MPLCPSYDCSRPDKIRLAFEPYPDISGRGVIIGFVGPAYFVFILLVGNYLLAHDPERAPFSSEHTSAVPAEFSWWRPNPIDVVFLRSFRHALSVVAPLRSIGDWWALRRQRIADAFDSVSG